MSTTMGETVLPCPECGAEIRTDNRFTTWCAACDWNVDPVGPKEPPGRLDRARRVWARRHGEKLLADMAADGTPHAGRGVSAVLANVVAGAVHGMTVVLVAAGVWCMVGASGAPAMVLGLLLLALAWTLRPRLVPLPRNEFLLLRAEAPALYELLDEIAGVAETRSVDVVAVDAKVGASVTTCGVRGQRLLTLGLPMWEILTPQQRVALLGHELGHYSSGDTRRGLIVATAFRSLTTWRYYLQPMSKPSGLEALLNLLCVVPRLLIQGAQTLLDQLTARAGQRTEYLADSVAARAGSTEAAVGLVDHILVADSAANALRREVNNPRVGRRDSQQAEEKADGLWERLTAHMESIPEHEYERQRRVGARRGHSIDSSHPPTHLRRECLLAGPPIPALVVTDSDREQRIAAELAEARRKVARQVMRDGFDD